MKGIILTCILALFSQGSAGEVTIDYKATPTPKPTICVSEELGLYADPNLGMSYHHCDVNSATTVGYFVYHIPEPTPTRNAYRWAMVTKRIREPYRTTIEVTTGKTINLCPEPLRVTCESELLQPRTETPTCNPTTTPTFWPKGTEDLEKMKELLKQLTKLIDELCPVYDIGEKK